MFVAAPIRRGMGDPTLLRPGEQALLSAANDATLNTLFQLSMPTAWTAPTSQILGIPGTPAPSTTPAPQPSNLSAWWAKSSALSDSLTNGNLVEIGGIFLGSMLLIGMVRRRK